MGSLTKSFTALAVMQLVEAHKLEFDAPVQRYLPNFRLADPVASAQITVRQLLNHQSGISTRDGMAGFAATDTAADALQHRIHTLSDLRLSAEPGARFEYSNLNYVILGAAIEAVSHEPYGQYLRQHVFLPLGMRTSTASEDEALRSEVALGARYWFGHAIAANRVPHLESNLPAGYVYSNAGDMGRYLMAQLNGGQVGNARVLSATGIDTLHRSAVAAWVHGMYAMGWTYDAADPSLIVHEGATANYHTYMAIDLDAGWGCALLLNANANLTGPHLSELGPQIVRQLRGEVATPLQLEPGLPLPLVALLALLTGQALFICWIGATIWRKWNEPAQKLPNKLRKVLCIALSMAVAIMIVAGLSIAVPGLYGMSPLTLMTMTPDAGWLLIGNSAMAVIWCVMLILRALKNNRKTVAT